MQTRCLNPSRPMVGGVVMLLILATASACSGTTATGATGDVPASTSMSSSLANPWHERLALADADPLSTRFGAVDWKAVRQHLGISVGTAPTPEQAKAIDALGIPTLPYFWEGGPESWLEGVGILPTDPDSAVDVSLPGRMRVRLEGKFDLAAVERAITDEKSFGADFDRVDIAGLQVLRYRGTEGTPDLSRPGRLNPAGKPHRFALGADRLLVTDTDEGMKALASSERSPSDVSRTAELATTLQTIGAVSVTVFPASDYSDSARPGSPELPNPDAELLGVGLRYDGDKPRGFAMIGAHGERAATGILSSWSKGLEAHPSLKTHQSWTAMLGKAVFTQHGRFGVATFDVPAQKELDAALQRYDTLFADGSA